MHSAHGDGLPKIAQHHKSSSRTIMGNTGHGAVDRNGAWRDAHIMEEEDESDVEVSCIDNDNDDDDDGCGRGRGSAARGGMAGLDLEMSPNRFQEGGMDIDLEEMGAEGEDRDGESFAVRARGERRKKKEKTGPALPGRSSRERLRDSIPCERDGNDISDGGVSDGSDDEGYPPIVLVDGGQVQVKSAVHVDADVDADVDGEVDMGVRSEGAGGDASTAIALDQDSDFNSEVELNVADAINVSGGVRRRSGPDSFSLPTHDDSDQIEEDQMGVAASDTSGATPIQRRKPGAIHRAGGDHRRVLEEDGDSSIDKNGSAACAVDLTDHDVHDQTQGLHPQFPSSPARAIGANGRAPLVDSKSDNASHEGFHSLEGWLMSPPQSPGLSGSPPDPRDEGSTARTRCDGTPTQRDRSDGGGRYDSPTSASSLSGVREPSERGGEEVDRKVEDIEGIGELDDGIRATADPRCADVLEPFDLSSPVKKESTADDRPGQSWFKDDIKEDVSAGRERAKCSTRDNLDRGSTDEEYERVDKKGSQEVAPTDAGAKRAARVAASRERARRFAMDELGIEVDGVERSRILSAEGSVGDGGSTPSATSGKEVTAEGDKGEKDGQVEKDDQQQEGSQDMPDNGQGRDLMDDGRGEGWEEESSWSVPTEECSFHSLPPAAIADADPSFLSGSHSPTPRASLESIRGRSNPARMDESVGDEEEGKHFRSSSSAYLLTPTSAETREADGRIGVAGTMGDSSTSLRRVACSPVPRQERALSSTPTLFGTPTSERAERTPECFASAGSTRVRVDGSSYGTPGSMDSRGEKGRREAVGVSLECSGSNQHGVEEEDVQMSEACHGSSQKERSRDSTHRESRLRTGASGSNSSGGGGGGDSGSGDMFKASVTTASMACDTHRGAADRAGYKCLRCRCSVGPESFEKAQDLLFNAWEREREGDMYGAMGMCLEAIKLCDEDWELHKTIKRIGLRMGCLS